MTAFLAASPWVAVAVPAVLALAIPLSSKWLGRGAVWLAVLGPISLLAVGASLITTGAVGGEAARTSGWSVPWLVQGRVSVGFALAADGLATLMLLVVGVVAFMVVVFSVGYMRDDPAYGRYFGLLSVFVASMTLLVLAENLIVLLVAWELVGACSYLLIGFWYRKPAAADAALKAFLVTHVGDAGLLLGIALLWAVGAPLAFSQLSHAALAPGVATAAALLLFLGAVGKSAQFPLHFWLPDAMEGPTPVSALIHAATMVAAGVFLLARLDPLFVASPTARTVVLVIGTFTALAAATIAVAQSDIKKVLAYSTISQLGFMFSALGVGAVGAAMFHLTTHASFKALLFLGAGSVIHGTGSQELSEMGGLARKMPVTATTWVIGALALAGVPPLAGFFSKDAVIAAVLHASPAAGIALLAASLLTAFYITRATALAFFGDYRGREHPHESGVVMAVPLMLLASAALVAGLLGARIAELLGRAEEAMQLPVALAAAAMAVIGIALAWAVYRRGQAADDAVALRLGSTWGAMRSGYGYDAAVDRLVVRPALAFARGLYSIVDRKTIDAGVEGTASATSSVGTWLARLQTGDAQFYAALIGVGVVVLMALSLVAGR